METYTSLTKRSSRNKKSEKRAEIRKDVLNLLSDKVPRGSMEIARSVGCGSNNNFGHVIQNIAFELAEERSPVRLKLDSTKKPHKWTTIDRS